MKSPQQQFVLNFYAYAALRDLDVCQLSHLSGIDPIALQNDSTLIPGQQDIAKLWQVASRLSRDPLFGLHLGEAMQLPALGAVGEIIKSSKTVGEAITHAAGMIGHFTDLVHMELEKTKDSFIIRLQPQENDPALIQAAHQTADMLMAFAVHELDGFLLRKIKPRTASCPVETALFSEYARVLRCELTRNKDHRQLEFDFAYWDEPILTASFELQELLLQRLPAPAQKENNNTGSLQTRISHYLSANAYLGIQSLEEVAANFHTSSRSLQRKLKAEGSSYQEIADETRKKLALYYLSSGQHPVKNVSYMLGYNELSAFTRAFKRWTGSAPVHYLRRRHENIA